MTASERVDSILEVWNKIDCVRFAVWCAKRVEHLSIGSTTGPAIAAVEKWIENPSRQIKYRADTASFAFAINHNQKYAHNAAYYAAWSATGSPIRPAGCATLACSASATASGDTNAYDLLQIYLSEQLLSAVNS
jgi:hypothetical protein